MQVYATEVDILICKVRVTLKGSKWFEIPMKVGFKTSRMSSNYAANSMSLVSNIHMYIRIYRFESFFENRIDGVLFDIRFPL